MYTEQYGIADLSESLEHICPQVWVLHDRFQASMIVFQNTFWRKKEKKIKPYYKKRISRAKRHAFYFALGYLEITELLIQVFNRPECCFQTSCLRCRLLYYDQCLKPKTKVITDNDRSDDHTITTKDNILWSKCRPRVN